MNYVFFCRVNMLVLVSNTTTDDSFYAFMYATNTPQIPELASTKCKDTKGKDCDKRTNEQISI